MCEKKLLIFTNPILNQTWEVTTEETLRVCTNTCRTQWKCHWLFIALTDPRIWFSNLNNIQSCVDYFSSPLTGELSNTVTVYVQPSLTSYSCSSHLIMRWKNKYFIRVDDKNKIWKHTARSQLLFAGWMQKWFKSSYWFAVRVWIVDSQNVKVFLSVFNLQWACRLWPKGKWEVWY